MKNSRGHLYQLKIFDDTFELRPLSSFLNQQTIVDSIENIQSVGIQAKALKIIRNIGFLEIEKYYLRSDKYERITKRSINH